MHNGIIENYHALRELLYNAGYSPFTSDTDSEIACAFIDYCYAKKKNKQDALAEAYKQFKGSFAFCILFDDEPNTIYAMRRNSPLILGIHDHGNYLASDISAFIKYTKQYIVLEHDEIARCTENSVAITTLHGDPIHKEVRMSELAVETIQKDGYDHFMLKEINEEPEVIEKTFRSLIPTEIDELSNILPNVSSYKHIHIVACGSALYAGMNAKSLIEKKARIPVDCVCASEYRYAHPIFQENTLLIAISQSGETADTIAALYLAKQHHVPTLGIVNVVGSTIARVADYIIQTQAGPEISVATTKAYCSQVAVMSLLARSLAHHHKQINDKDFADMTNQFYKLPEQMKELLQHPIYKTIASKLYLHEHVFFIGRGIDYAISLEGSLKLKEISYIHSEAYPAGELKHGTISLIEKGTPVIALATDYNVYAKTISNIKEVKARGAYVVLITLSEYQIDEDCFDDIIYIPHIDIFLQSIVTIIPLQLLAYETAKLRDCEIDQPRNLAKSVTVE